MGIKKRTNYKYYLVEDILKKRIVNGKVIQYKIHLKQLTKKPKFPNAKVQCFIQWLNYSKKFNSWTPEENIIDLVPSKRKLRKTKHETREVLPIKILAKFENNWCLVKWKNGKTSTMELTPGQVYNVIVNGSLT